MTTTRRRWKKKTNNECTRLDDNRHLRAFLHNLLITSFETVPKGMKQTLIQTLKIYYIKIIMVAYVQQYQDYNFQTT